MKHGFYFFLHSIGLISTLLLGIGLGSSFLPLLRAENPVPDSLPPKVAPESRKKFLDVPRIKLEELKKLIDKKADIVIVDTQDEKIYQVSHIKGAVNFPWAPTIKNPINLPRNTTLIIYCGCIDQEASLDVATQLIRDYGYKDIKILEGGFQQWLKLGYPIEKSRRK
jgi:3-mercaptopyruvate sulfurtransferase SseA